MRSSDSSPPARLTCACWRSRTCSSTLTGCAPGRASRLVEDLLATAGGNAVRRIEVTANPHATAFYRHVGFVHGHDSETRLGGAPRMYLTLHRDQADQSDTGFDAR